jgi:amino acid adenylation domain-containing protein
MTVAAFLSDLRRRGVSLSTDGEQLTLRAPKGVLGNVERERLKAEKAAILECLRAEQVAVDDGAPFPLTDIQQAYLVGRAAELELGKVGCHAYREFDCATVDLPRLERAWNKVVARHPMLRAVFSADGTQRVLDSVPSYRIEIEDLRGTADAPAILQHRREARSHRVFDPERWPLFEINAIQLEDRVRLSVGVDLLIADAAALITLFREWGTFYRDPDHDLSPLAGRFADHARRLPQPTARERAYWEARLDTLPPGPDLPRLPLSQPPRFVRRSLKLDASCWRELKQAARAQGLTPSALVAAVYADVLAAWNRRAHFSLILTQFAAPEDMRGVVGDFTSTILLEVDTSLPSFLQRARAVQKRLLADLDHAAMSGVAVLRELRRRGPDVEPVSVVFTSALGHPGLDPDAPSPLAWLGQTVFAITQTPQVAMDHHVFEEDGALVASWDVVEALFPAAVIDAMVQAYGALLQALASGTGWERGAIPVTGPRAVLEPAATPEFLHAAFERQARAKPTRTALIAPDLELDYATLDAASARLAAMLVERLAGTPRDRLVAIVLPKGWRQIVAVLAVLKAGAAYLPIDPTLPIERRKRLIERSQALVLESSAEIDQALQAARSGIAVPALPPVEDPSRLAYVIYTSGSTGEPKGVMIEHRAAVATVAEINRRWSVGPEDRVLGLSSLSFDLSVYDIFGLLGVGGALVLPDAEASRDPAQWSALLTRHGVTVWNSVPALMAMQAEYGLPKGHKLRLVMMSGDWVPVELVQRLQAASPSTRVVSLGGATEASIWSNAHEVEALDPSWPSIPYGTPLKGQMLHVVNGRGEDCPDWVIGEIEISGAGVARGYWRDAAQTAERFRVDARTGERRYRTGDLGRFRPYGAASSTTPIEFLGREDFQVKVQGYRIELGEIETALGSHPDVQQAVVAALPTAGDKTLHAFIVLRPEAWDRARFLLERHGVRRMAESSHFALSGRPEAEIYDSRRSVRRFTPEAVDRSDLDRLLAAAGPLSARMLTRRVVGWTEQAFDDYVVPDRATARIAAAAAFLIVLDAPTGMPARTALVEAGAAGQRLMLAAQESGLGLCPIGVLTIEGRRVLHAFAGGQPATETAGFDIAGTLREHCAAQLPAYMVPRHVHFLPSLPLSANGKVDRGALRPLVEAPVTTGGSNDAMVAKVGALAAEILGRPVQPRQNLFDCGATSLHIVRLQRKLTDQLGSPLAVVDLFRLPTVADLAAAISGSQQTDAVEAGLARAARRREMRTGRARAAVGGAS